MYAIIVDGGRQYRVEEGQQLDVDYREMAKGAELQFESVTAEVVGVTLGEKLTVQKLRRRNDSRKRTGHRQMYTTVRINKILS